MYGVEHAGQNDMSKGIIDNLLSSSFWTNVELFKELLQPIDEAIKMSESDKGHLGLVLSRWASIRSHLTRTAITFPSLHAFLNSNGSFDARFKRQVRSIHIVSTYLNPQHWALPIDADSEHKIFEFIDKYTESEDEAAVARCEFLYFRSQSNPFESSRYCWKHSKDPRTFWLMQQQHAKVLGPLSLRIFSTPSNSVPSERAFSVMNFLHSKARNSLESERVDKLTYTYINTRIFRRIEKADVVNQPILDFHELTEEQEVELEEHLLETEGMSDIDESFEADKY